MSVALDLTEDVVRRLTAEAQRRGVAIADVVTDLATQLPAPDQRRRRRLAFVGVGASTSDLSDRVDEILAEGFGQH